MIRSFLIATLFGATLFMSCDGDTGNGSEPEEYPDLSLGWGRLLAEEVRDAELAGGEQIYAFAAFVDGDGLLEYADSFYRFFFAEPTSLLDTDGLWVTVYHSGDTGHSAGKCAYGEPLPVFSDAAPWIETADGALETIGGVEYTHRTYEVREGRQLYEPPDAFVVQVDYWLEENEHRARVILNAETNEIIDIEDHR